jgi:hypothetical protein
MPPINTAAQNIPIGLRILRPPAIASLAQNARSVPFAAAG